MNTSNSEPTIHELFDLSGKVALVTGASGHLGQSFARALAEAGASVIVASRDESRAAETARALPGDGPHHGVVIDHMNEDSIHKGFAQAMKRAGKIDIVINNGHEPQPQDWSTVTGEQFTRQLANATGYFLLARELRNHAVARNGSGSVVMIGSMYGLVGSYPDTYKGIVPASPVAYHTLKGGVLHLTRHLAVYWARDGVRVNCLSPGPFPGQRAKPELVQRLTTKSPMARMGKPHELKGALLLLASDAGSYITGQNLVVDGGWTAW